MAYSERELLARMVQCEACGKSDNWMNATATISQTGFYGNRQVAFRNSFNY